MSVPVCANCGQNPCKCPLRLARDQIRKLAQSLGIGPEVVTGPSGVGHWSAWRIGVGDQAPATGAQG